MGLLALAGLASTWQNYTLRLSPHLGPPSMTFQSFPVFSASKAEPLARARGRSQAELAIAVLRAALQLLLWYWSLEQRSNPLSACLPP